METEREVITAQNETKTSRWYQLLFISYIETNFQFVGPGSATRARSGCPTPTG